MAFWKPPFDECRSCKFFRRQKRQPICKFCGAGEFFEEKDPSDADPDIDALMRIYERMTEGAEEGRTIPHESDAVRRADESNDEHN